MTVIAQVFVGTMYCGEGDYPHCAKTIIEQSGVTVRHQVISNLPEKEAHNRLWQAWREVQHQGYDMFVKVDADTVLAHDKVLLEFWKMMSTNPRITGIQAPLLDYFTDGFINGLNCFSPRVTFRDTADELFCDRQVDVDHDIVIKSDQVSMGLRPAGYHGFNPTDAQAFHYGVHRMLKNQASVIAAVRQAWQRFGGRGRTLALIGAQCAPNFREGGFNYSDERFKVALDGVLKKYDELKTAL